MMNASFRTAFWAMCLGLTVPMMLFVAVELTSGGRTLSGRRAIANLSPGSLQSRWNGRPVAAGKARPDEGRPDSAGSNGTRSRRSGPDRQTTGIAKLIPQLETDGSSSGVTLDPQLELDQPGGDQAIATIGRVPALPTAARPRIEIIPEALAGLRPTSNARIEAQLDEILGHLGRLANTVGDRKPPPDSMQQATEFLKRLQEARRADELASQLTEPAVETPETREAASGETSDVTVPPSTAPAETAELPATPEQSTAPQHSTRPEHSPRPARLQPQTKIYRPRYIGVRSLEALVAPMLTPGVGRIGSASNAGEGDPSERQSQLPTQWDAVVVRDVPEVLRKVDRLLQELDVPPLQILVEATILTIRLTPTMPFGLDLAEFNANGQAFSISPADLAGSGFWNAIQPAAGSTSPMLEHGTGVKCGVLRGDVRAFLQVLQTAAQIRGTAAAQASVLNKQSTELLLSDGYLASDGSRPMSPATILRIQPIVGRDGLIHLDIRPSLNAESATWMQAVSARGGSLANQLTLRPGETAVVSGFISDHMVAYSYHTPGIGEIPLVGRMFRGQTGVVERTETIVLLTPHLADRSSPASEELPPASALRKTSRKVSPTESTAQSERPTSDAVNRPAARLAAKRRSSGKKSGKPGEVSAKTPRVPATAKKSDKTKPAIQQTAGVAGAVAASPGDSPNDRPGPSPRDMSNEKPTTDGSLEAIPEVPPATDDSPRPLIRPAFTPARKRSPHSGEGW